MDEQKMDLNSATAQELTQLPGIGPARAERIVRYRVTVHPFEEPAQITAVPGIGDRTYSTIADRLTVAPAERGSAPPIGASEGEVGPELRPNAVPPGESIAGEELTREALASEERWPDTGETSAEVTGKGPSETEEVLAEEEAAVEEQPAREAPSAERSLPPASSPPPSEPAAPSLWSQLSWLWTAMLGGFLGMVFALVVLAGINGSLDIARSRAVLNIESRIEGLAADVDSLEGDVDGLRKRLDALEGLTARMDRVESATDDLREQTTDLNERTQRLEEDVAAVSEELQVLSDDVATLQEQAEQTRSFFLRLRSMLNDIFGEVEERSPPPPSESK